MIQFDCLPMRSLGRVDIPLDASPAFEAKAERIKAALAKHGRHNSFYLHNASCCFRLTNDQCVGMLEFSFEGTVLTDVEDRHAERCDLGVELRRETCDWLTQPVVHWFCESVERAVLVEFDRYIATGDLQKTVVRAEKLQAETDSHSGFVGMGL
jgi:hypothetical protein